MAILPDHVRDLIDAPNIAHLGVNTAAGPHVSAVWIDRDDDRILVNTAEGRVKSQALRDDPRVGISIVASEDAYTNAVIQGRVVEFRQEGARAHIDALAKKYFGRDEYDGPADEQRVILVIEVDKVAGNATS